MYPGTIFRWHDQSEIVANTPVDSVDNSPLFLQVFSSDKGTEDLIEITRDNFKNMYGTMNFARHGQSAIQAQNIVNAGGRLLAKRVVAPDSELANTVIIANLSVINEGQISVRWSAETISGCKNFKELKEAALALSDPTNGKYPLIIYAENGRGTSNKAVRINPDYTVSKTIGKTFYTFSVYEGANNVENKTVSFDPTVIYSNEAYYISKDTCMQVDAEILDSVYDAYLADVAANLGMEEDVIRNYDLIFGYTNAGKVLDGFTYDPDSVDLDAEVGIAIQGGSNGSFGDAPVNTADWTQAIVDVFNGTFNPMIYDVDTYKIALVIDANYPTAVKNAIADFVNFREDCMYLRDFGTGLTTFLEIKTEYDKYEDYRSRYIADYCTSYQIKDPFTKKNIEVTMLYDLAYNLVSHLANSPFSPVAGIINGFVLANPIKGTVNFIPVITPSVNQKEALEDIKVNYAIFNENQCVVQTNYTSQEIYTQLSYICNVLAIQNVLRTIRTECPKNRYSLANGKDLDNYANAINNVLANFSSHFSVLKFEYVQDDLKAAQKIFYASIRFAFRNWAQTEIFDIYAING